MLNLTQIFLLCRKKTKPTNKQRRQESSSSSSDEEPLLDESDGDSAEETADAECFVCYGLFSEDIHGEEWVKCSKCFKWGHGKCTYFKKKAKFICSDCLN